MAVESSYTNKMLKVLSVFVPQTNGAEKMPSQMGVSVEKALSIGVPIQIQFEIIPNLEMGYTTDGEVLDANLEAILLTGFHAYGCAIMSVKARIKPGTSEFNEAEGKNLNHVINGTEDTAQLTERAKKRVDLIRKADETNRFIGLEI